MSELPLHDSARDLLFMSETSTTHQKMNNRLEIMVRIHPLSCSASAAMTRMDSSHYLSYARKQLIYLPIYSSPTNLFIHER